MQLIDGIPFPYWPTPNTPRYVNVYAVSRAYGGPEEGGWYFDIGEVVASHPVRGERQEAILLAAMTELYGHLGKKDRNGGMGRFSVMGGSDYVICVEDEKAEPFPAEYPHYE